MRSISSIGLREQLRAGVGLLAQERDRDRVGAVGVRARAERARHLLLLLGVELLPARRSLEGRERFVVGRAPLLDRRGPPRLERLLERARVLVDARQLAEEGLALEDVLELRGVLADRRR